MNRRTWSMAAAVGFILATGTVIGLTQSWLPNLRIVRHGVLWRSGQPSPLGLWLAHWAGVKTIVCLRDGDEAEVQAEAEFAARHGIRFIGNPLRFSGEGLDATVTHFLEAVGDVRHQPVLVHCARGKERSGVCGAVFRMEFDGWTHEQALREMYALGLVPGSLPALERYVASYEPRWRPWEVASADGAARRWEPGPTAEPGPAVAVP